MESSKSVFKVLNTFEIFNYKYSGYRAEITTVENAPYVVISKHVDGRPTKKQIFLPPPAWSALLQFSGEISYALDAIDGGNSKGGRLVRRSAEGVGVADFDGGYCSGSDSCTINIGRSSKERNKKKDKTVPKVTLHWKESEVLDTDTGTEIWPKPKGGEKCESLNDWAKRHGY